MSQGVAACRKLCRKLSQVSQAVASVAGVASCHININFRITFASPGGQAGYININFSSININIKITFPESRARKG